jgi:hypothetical protein
MSEYIWVAVDPKGKAVFVEQRPEVPELRVKSTRQLIQKGKPAKDIYRHEPIYARADNTTTSELSEAEQFATEAAAKEFAATFGAGFIARRFHQP